MTYSHLLSAGSIAGMTLKNRIMLSAMGSMYAETDGTCAERIWDYYEERARGGTGLLILETSAALWPSGTSMPCMIGFSEERFLPGLQELTRRVHQHGAKIAAQLNHSGKASQADVGAGRPVLVPSIPKPAKGDLMRALTQAEMATFISAAGPDGKGPRYQPMSREDIQQFVAQFADAAGLAKRAGFDAIEIHAGHGYLIAAFLSPYANDREDDYGGSTENRARLLTEIIQSTRDAVGPDFPILVRIDGHEYRIDGGITIDLAVETARLLESAGADAIDVSAYGNGLSGIAFTEAPLVHEPAGLMPFAHAIKQAVSIPVIGVGRLEPDVADGEIGAGRIDFVAMGRKLLADPELPNKLAADQAEKIRPCIYCYVCVSKIFLTQPMVCAVNPGCGREADLGKIEPAQEPKQIAVVGGGPGGLEAARVLAKRGHHVTLWEREKDLGGTARIAALPYEPNARIITWLIDAVKAANVDLRLGQDATRERLQAARPDHVVVATGASRAAPEIPGKELDHVFDGDRLRAVLMGGDASAARGLPLWQRLMIAVGRLTGITRHIGMLRTMSRYWMPLGKRVVLIGGGLVGLELAEYLVERGREVTVLEPSPNLGAELSVVRRARVLHCLREAEVKMVANARIAEITNAGVGYSVKGEDNFADANHVIISLGAAADPRFADTLNEAGLAVSTVGDCAEVGYIEGAILSAREVSVSL